MHTNTKILVKSPTLTEKLYEDKNICAGKLDKDSCLVSTNESQKQHLRRPHFSKGLTKLAILPDYECPGLICLALLARRKFGLILVIKFFLVEVMKKLS